MTKCKPQNSQFIEQTQLTNGLTFSSIQIQWRISKHLETISMLNAKSMMQRIETVCCLCSHCCSAVKLDFIQAKTDIS